MKENQKREPGRRRAALAEGCLNRRGMQGIIWKWFGGNVRLITLMLTLDRQENQSMKQSRITVRVTKTTLTGIRQRAKPKGISVSRYVGQIVEAAVDDLSSRRKPRKSSKSSSLKSAKQEIFLKLLRERSWRP